MYGLIENNTWHEKTLDFDYSVGVDERQITERQGRAIREGALSKLQANLNRLWPGRRLRRLTLHQIDYGNELIYAGEKVNGRLYTRCQQMGFYAEAAFYFWSNCTARPLKHRGGFDFSFGQNRWEIKSRSVLWVPGKTTTTFVRRYDADVFVLYCFIEICHDIFYWNHGYIFGKDIELYGRPKLLKNKDQANGKDFLGYDVPLDSFTPLPIQFTPRRTSDQPRP